MTEIKGVHAGANSIFFKSLFEKNAFQTPWWFIHSAFIPPGGGIGHHCHDHMTYRQLHGGKDVVGDRVVWG
jgi:hypothetical protein